MVENAKVLEVLIPTFGRPESAAEAVDSALRSSDTRLSIRCNSNGFEQTLEKYRDFDSRLIYDSFKVNKGVHANIFHLLNSSEANFCMLLSDEDRIDPEGVSSLLDFLENLSPSTTVVYSSVFDSARSCFLSLPAKRYEQTNCGLELFAALWLVPTYMSGVIYRTDKLRCLDLGRLMHPLPGNAYPHLNIASQLLIDSSLRFYLPKVVLKGEDITTGGDGYAHRSSIPNPAVEHPDLNPSIYGPYPRCRQFFYQLEQLSILKHKLDRVAYCLAVLKWILFFSYFTRCSPHLVSLTEEKNYEAEVNRALKDFALENHNRFSLLSYAFRFLVLAPALIFTPVYLCLRLLYILEGRFYAIYTQFLKTENFLPKNEIK